MQKENSVTIELTELKAELFDKYVRDIAKNPDDDNCCTVATNMLIAGEIIGVIENLSKGCE